MVAGLPALLSGIPAGKPPGQAEAVRLLAGLPLALLQLLERELSSSSDCMLDSEPSAINPFLLEAPSNR